MNSTSEVTIGGLVGTRWKPALSVEVTDGIAIITFDLPNESVNKLNRAVKDEFVALVSRLERDTTVQAAVFLSGKQDVWIVSTRDGPGLTTFVLRADATGLRAGTYKGVVLASTSTTSMQVSVRILVP